MKDRLPEVIVFAGPNGSGKSTITDAVDLNGYVYINADEIKKALLCDDTFAAQMAGQQSNKCIDGCKNFAFETVLSTDRNIQLLRRVKAQGDFIKALSKTFTHFLVKSRFLRVISIA